MIIEGGPRSLSQEAREFTISHDPQWLGGVFEVGGTVSFEIEERLQRGKTYTRPTLGLNDKMRGLGMTLRGIHGGNWDEKSGKWIIKSKKAAELILSMEKFAPSRRDTIAAVELWSAAADLHEKEEIVRLYREMPGVDVDADAYENLVRSPRFLAGVIDNRGTLYQSRNDLRVSSANKTLLDALEARYGGTVSKEDVSGEVKMIYGQEYVLKKDGYIWYLTPNAKDNVVDIVTPYSLLGKVYTPTAA